MWQRAEVDYNSAGHFWSLNDDLKVVYLGWRASWFDASDDLPSNNEWLFELSGLLEFVSKASVMLIQAAKAGECRWWSFADGELIPLRASRSEAEARASAPLETHIIFDATSLRAVLAAASESVLELARSGAGNVDPSVMEQLKHPRDFVGDVVMLLEAVEPWLVLLGDKIGNGTPENPHGRCDVMLRLRRMVSMIKRDESYRPQRGEIFQDFIRHGWVINPNNVYGVPGVLMYANGAGLPDVGAGLEVQVTHDRIRIFSKEFFGEQYSKNSWWDTKTVAVFSDFNAFNEWCISKGSISEAALPAYAQGMD